VRQGTRAQGPWGGEGAAGAGGPRGPGALIPEPLGKGEGPIPGAHGGCCGWICSGEGTGCEAAAPAAASQGVAGRPRPRCAPVSTPACGGGGGCIAAAAAAAAAAKAEGVPMGQWTIRVPLVYPRGCVCPREEGAGDGRRRGRPRPSLTSSPPAGSRPWQPSCQRAMRLSSPQRLPLLLPPPSLLPLLWTPRPMPLWKHRWDPTRYPRHTGGSDVAGAKAWPDSTGCHGFAALGR